VLAESPGELARFRCRREAVAITLEDEPRHRHAVDVIHWRRGVEALGFLVEERFYDMRADQPRHECRSVHPHSVRQVVHAVIGDDSLHGRVASVVVRSGVPVSGERGHRGDVGARRVAGDRDERRVDAVVIAVLAQPGHGTFRIDDMVRVGRARAQPVVGVRADPTERREVIAERQALFALVAEHPGAAVNEDQGRPPVAVAGAAIDVHRKDFSFAPGERHVAQNRDAFAHPRDRLVEQVSRQALDIVEFHLGCDGFRHRRGAQAGQPEYEQHAAGSERKEERHVAGPAVERTEQREHNGKHERDTNVERRKVQRKERQQPARHDRDRPARRLRRVDDDRRAEKGNEQEQPSRHRFADACITAERRLWAQWPDDFK